MAELSDWLLEKMLVAQEAGDQDGSGVGGTWSEADIKRVFKKRDAELKQLQTEYKARLSDTRLALSRLEESDADGRGSRSPSVNIPSHPSKSSKQPSVVAEDTGQFIHPIL